MDITQEAVVRLDSIQAIAEREQHKDCGTCNRCCRPWAAVNGHVTLTEDFQMVALCDDCWFSLTPKGRIPYYLVLHYKWQICHGGSPYTEEQVVRAVLSE